MQRREQVLKIGSLCTGYGGLDLAVEAHFNAETIWCAEFDKYASQVIEKRFNIPNYGDIKSINWHELEPIDILTAGYPCQPFSHAGERKGTDDPRHIFPYIAQAIYALRPKYFVFENVRGHLSLGFKEVLEILAPMGYVVRWGLVRASDAGAPHRRERLFIVGKLKSSHSDSIGQYLRESSTSGNQRESQPQFTSSGETTTNAGSERLQQPTKIRQLERIRFSKSSEIASLEPPSALVEDKLNAKFVEYMMGLPNGWVTDVDMGRRQHLKILGNGVVPQQAKLALELLTNGF